MNPLAEITTNSVILYKDKVGIQIPTGLHDLQVETHRDMFTDMLLVRLRAYVLSEHLVADTQERTTTAPKTLWDHAKHDLKEWSARKPCRILTRRWIRERKINYRTITMTASWTRNATRPESTIRFPDKLGPVVYQETSSSELWEG